MANILSSLKDNKGAYQASKRKGRGIGSGKGKTAGRGVKGQKSRSGVAINGFEGGQMPIYRRLPKRGFNNISRKESETINLSQLQRFVDAKKLKTTGTVGREQLIEAGIVDGKTDFIKLLAKGELTAKINLEIDAASEAAIKAVEKAGGKITVTGKDAKIVAERAAQQAAKKPAKKATAKKDAK